MCTICSWSLCLLCPSEVRRGQGNPGVNFLVFSVLPRVEEQTPNPISTDTLTTSVTGLGGRAMKAK